ncbi:MAG: hypothetical protein K2J60_00965 [Acetatifactor sp.]|nr:hypothetical protein [Acetatifactor sp.]
MKWLKNSYYLILLVTVGIVYLSTVDQWKVYAQVIEQVKEFCLGDVEQENQKKNADDSGPGQEDQSGQDAAESGTGNIADGIGNLTSATSDTADDGQGQNMADTENGQGQDVVNAGDGTAEQPVTRPTEPAAPTEPGAPLDPVVPTEPDAPVEPVFVTVEDEYFSDAVFIGDSRTVGMCEYGGLEEISTFYASTGLTVYKIFDAAIVEVPGQKKKITIEDALQENSFAKIYLMIGINEMGVGTVETFTEKYREVVEHLQELQPDAIIYIQGIIKVTTERSDQGDYINNEGIEARNLELEKLADNRSIFYLDVNPLICDETGGLVDSYTFDGVHLKAKYIQIWKDYLKENAVQINFS